MTAVTTNYTDFLDRHLTTFIKASVENRFEGESTLEKGTSFTEFLLKGFEHANQSEPIAKAYELSCNAISTICPIHVQYLFTLQVRSLLPAIRSTLKLLFLMIIA